MNIYTKILIALRIMQIRRFKTKVDYGYLITNQKRYNPFNPLTYFFLGIAIIILIPLDGIKETFSGLKSSFKWAIITTLKS